MRIIFLTQNLRNQTFQNNSSGQRMHQQMPDTVSFGSAGKLNISRIKNELNYAIKNNNAKEIFKYFNIDITEDKNGFFSISHYKQPSHDITFAQLGIDENKLFEKVKEINGNADFINSKLLSLQNLKRIRGRASFYNSQINDMGSLESIDEFASFSNSKFTSLKNLEFIGDYADFRDSKITDTGALKAIGGSVDFSHSEITDLKNLKIILGDADFRNSKITNLGALEYIGKDIYLKDSKLTPEKFINLRSKKNFVLI